MAQHEARFRDVLHFGGDDAEPNPAETAEEPPEPASEPPGDAGTIVPVEEAVARMNQAGRSVMTTEETESVLPGPVEIEDDTGDGEEASGSVLIHLN